MPWLDYVTGQDMTYYAYLLRFVVASFGLASLDYTHIFQGYASDTGELVLPSSVNRETF